MKFISHSNGIFKDRKSFTLLFVVILAIVLSFNPFKDYNYNLEEYQEIVENENLKISNTGDNIFRLIYGTLDGPADLDPHNAWDRLSFEVIDQVCEGLFAYNTSDPSLSLLPILAEDFGTFTGLKNYTIDLRQGVVFHDGTPFNATAVKWSFDRLKYFIDNNMSKNAELYQFYNSTLKEYVLYIKETTVINEFTVSFLLNEPYPNFPLLLTIPSSYILSPSSTPASDLIDTASGDLVGTGPFVYDYYKPNSKVKFHAFDNYWGGISNVSILEFSIINDATLRNTALLTGDVDIISDPLNTLVPTFEVNPDTTLTNSSYSLTCNYLGMNNYWINNTFRKAISYAINYSYIYENLMRENALRLKTPVPPEVPYHNSSVSPPEFNISYAREIMQTMGFGVGWNTTYPGTDENMWSSATFETFNYTYYIGDWLLEEIFNVLYNNLSRIGIKVFKVNTTYKNYNKYLFNDANFNRNMLQLFWFSWDPPYLHPFMYLYPLFTNRSNSANFMQYNGGYGQNGPFKPYGSHNYDSNKDVQILMEQALVETNWSIQIALYQKIQSLIVERDFACGFLFEDTKYYAHRNYILGFIPNALGKLHFHKLLQDSTKNPRNTIYLDGNIDWYFFKDFGNCTGFGNFSHPYIINDIKIGNEPSKSCVLIENSDVYFKIENCTLFNSKKGVELINVKNAILYDNNCSNNVYGISMINCTLVNATKNKVNYNELHGLDMQHSHNSTIIKNIATNNDDGIRVYKGTNNTILENDINLNSNGIMLSYVNSSEILRNSANYNTYGIHLYYSNNSILSENIASNNSDAGIRLWDSNNNLISENSLNNNKYKGLFLYESNNNTIIDNKETISYNEMYGIYLELSNFNNISKNTINYNYYGIYLYQSNYSYIVENDLIGNVKAIEEIDCIGNLIENNIIPKSGAIPVEILIIIIMIGVVSVIGIGGVIAWKKGITLPIKTKKRKIEKIKPEKEEKDVLKIEKQKNKIIKKLQKRMITVESLIADNKTKITLEKLNEMEDIAKSYDLIDILEKIEEKFDLCKRIEIDTINRIKTTVLNLGTKFTRLELMDISEKSGIKDENLIEIVIQDMIKHKEIVGEYFASSKALALEVAAPISKPEKEKEYSIFLSYSTLDTDYFQISKVVRRLELYPEISEVLFWEVDSKQNIVEFMEETLKKTNVFVLFCSENSIKSRAVKDEWQSAFQLRKEGLMKMVPVYKEEEHLPYLLKPMLNVKFTGDDFEGFIQKLYEEILR